MKPGNNSQRGENGANSGGIYREMRDGKDRDGIACLYFPPSSARWMRAFSLVHMPNDHDEDEYARKAEDREP